MGGNISLLTTEGQGLSYLGLSVLAWIPSPGAVHSCLTVVEAGVFGSIPCIDLLSAEITYEGMILNEIDTQRYIKDAWHRP